MTGWEKRKVAIEIIFYLTIKAFAPVSENMKRKLNGGT